jgi:putative membrane protein
MEEPATALGTVLGTLQTGLPVLLLQFATTLALLALGMACYGLATPFHEWRLVREGNVAAGVVLAGTFVALAIPLAATLATSLVTLDIVLWGLVALVIQLLTLAAATLLFRGLRGMIEAGNVAAAAVLAGIQIAVALLNAGAMAG